MTAIREYTDDDSRAPVRAECVVTDRTVFWIVIALGLLAAAFIP